MTIGIQQGVRSNARIGAAGLRCGGRLRVERRNIVEHDDADGTLGVSGRDLFRDCRFDQAEEVRPIPRRQIRHYGHGTSAGVALLSYLFRCALLLVRSAVVPYKYGPVWR